MNPTAIKQLQMTLKLPQTGVMDDATVSAMSNAVKTSVASNPDIIKYGGVNTPDTILDAYMTNNWSNVIDITGKPFTKAQQQQAFAEADKALAPAYKAQVAFDNAGTEDTLKGYQEQFGQFQKSEAEDFGNAKDAQDQNAADQGILFTGSRAQKLRDLKNTYQDREAIARGATEQNIQSTARSNQYKYGDQAASGLKDFYALPGSSTFNPNVAGGKVNPGGLSSAYNAGQYNFQGTAPVAQKAAINVRAAGLLSNRANKLTATGYKNQF